MKTKKYIHEVCTWSNRSGLPCKEPAMLDSRFCMLHYYMSSDFLKNDYAVEPEIIDSRTVSWQEELDREYAAYEFSKKHGKSKPAANDFPGYFDGMFYESMMDYESNDFYYDGIEEEYHQDRGSYDNAAGFRAATAPYYNRLPTVYTPYVKKDLKVGHWDVIDTVGHMQYIVVHAKDSKYYSVWLSLYSDGDEKTAMKYIRENCPVYLPVRKTGFTYYTSGSHPSYDGAKNSLHKGMESSYKISKRYKDSKSKDWIPPNLRELGHFHMFHLIPKKWNKIVCDWVKDGCKGWYKTKYIPKKTEKEIVETLKIIEEKNEPYPWDEYITEY